MEARTKALIEILKRPAEFPVEIVIRAMAEIKKISFGEYRFAFAGIEGAAPGGKNAA